MLVATRRAPRPDLPVVLGVIAGRLTLRPSVEKALDFIGLGYVDRMPSAWDFAMRQRQPNDLRSHLKDGRGVVGGVFANRSFGSLDPKRADVDLAQAWQLDERGIFLQPIPGSHGLWVAHDAMAYVYFLEGVRGPDGEEAAPQRHDPRSPEADGEPMDEAGSRQARRPASRNRQTLPTAPDAAPRPRSKRKLTSYLGQVAKARKTAPSLPSGKPLSPAGGPAPSPPP